MPGTTVWIDRDTREALRRLQESFGTASVNDTLKRLLAQPAQDARSIFEAHRGQIGSILRRRRLRGLVAFGSRARGDATAESDLDLAARAAPGASPLAFLAAEADLETELGVKVNLVEIPNPRLDAVIRREGVRFDE